MMTSEHWSRIEEIFQNALERPASEWGAYVAFACGGDQDLRSEVESLLANDRDAAAVLWSVVTSDVKELAASSSQIGRRIGPYRLVREIDSGGMGVVYLAVRSDDHYFQVVALKMIRKGWESPALVRRFRAERQILATLSHPNIGAILDGGETEDGHPFIVMEYVEGQPITVACQSQDWPIRQRLELFRSVCFAVHYAHQKLVIHRDIKPSNVLVTPDGVVKLIDFGVSKALAPGLVAGGLPQTETCQRLMTPDYASPEQLLGRELTAATDIYSLGVLLFELLTGAHPYTLSNLSPAAAERIVCYEESRKPSSVRELPQGIREELAGDLDRIVLMAMEKDPFRRYPSAQQLEEDLVRFLEDKPILARKATPVYRLSKFIKRHPTASLMTLAALVVLAGAIALISWQSRIAERRVKQFQALIDSAISDLADKLQASSQSTALQASLFHSALSSLEQLRKTSGNDPRLLLQLSKAYERVADLEGWPYVANLGNWATAEVSYREELRLAIEAHKRLPDDESTGAVIESLQKLGGLEYFLGKQPDANANFTECLSIARDFWQRKPDDPGRRLLLANTYLSVGDLQLDSMVPNKALDSFRATSQVFGSDPNGQEAHDRVLSRVFMSFGKAFMQSGSKSDALPNFHRAIVIARDVTAKFPSSKHDRRFLFSLYETFVGYLAGREALNVGDSKAARFYSQEARAIAQDLAASDPDNLQARNDLAVAAQGVGDSFRLIQPATAAEWYRNAISLAQEIAPRYPAGSQIQEAIAHREEALAAVLGDRTHAVERKQLLEEANQSWKELVRTNSGKLLNLVHLMRSYCKLSDAELAVNDIGKARQYAESSSPFFDQFKVTSPSLLVLRDLGFCYESLGNVQHRISVDPSFRAEERRAAATEARKWYGQSAGVWNEWNRRGAASEESELERHKVEHLLRSTK